MSHDSANVNDDGDDDDVQNDKWWLYSWWDWGQVTSSISSQYNRLSVWVPWNGIACMEPSNSKTGASKNITHSMKMWISQTKKVHLFPYRKQPNLGLRSNFWLSTLATGLRGMECCAQVKFQHPFIIFIGHETLPWISHWSPFSVFDVFFALPSGSSALAATFAWWFAAEPWFHRKLSRTFFSLNHLNLKSFSIIYKDLASFSSYILSLDASVRSKLTCLWHVGSLPAWYIQLHLSFKRCLSAWFQQPSPTAQLGESTLRYYKDHWLAGLDSWATHDFASFHLLCWNAPKAIDTVLEVSYNCCQFEFRTIINFCILSMSFRFFCLGQPLMEEIWRNCPQLWTLWPGHPAIEPTKLHFFSKLALFNPCLTYFYVSYASVGLNWCWTL